MSEVTLEHNLDDHELVDVLEKAIGRLKAGLERSGRTFNDRYMEFLAVRGTGVFEDQMQRMMQRIERVMAGQ